MKVTTDQLLAGRFGKILNDLGLIMKQPAYCKYLLHMGLQVCGAQAQLQFRCVSRFLATRSLYFSGFYSNFVP